VAQLGSRYLVYGLAEPGVHAITLRGKSYPTGPRGAFLLVFDGRASSNPPLVKFDKA